MKKLSKEEILVWIGENEKADYKAHNIFFGGQFNENVRIQLRETIENWPEVDEEIIDKYMTLSKCAGSIEEYDELKKEFIDELTEAGMRVRVKEGRNV